MSNRFALDSRVALVTGAGGGLGSSFARTLAEAGATVVLCGRHRQPLEKVAKAIEAAGGAAFIAAMDVTDRSSVVAAFDAASVDAGVIDIVVCCAGIVRANPALDMTDAEWEQTLDVNLTGSWRVAQEAARRLKAASQPGSIILVSSILGQRVAGTLSAYTASKGGVEQLARTLALEWARAGIRVNTIAPGYMETELNRDFFRSDQGRKLVRRIPQRRLGRTDELAGALLLLASDAGSYMTGSTLVVDGGHLQSSL